MKVEIVSKLDDLTGEIPELDKIRVLYFDGSFYLAHPHHPLLKLSLDYEYFPKLEIFDGS